MAKVIIGKFDHNGFIRIKEVNNNTFENFGKTLINKYHDQSHIDQLLQKTRFFRNQHNDVSDELETYVTIEDLIQSCKNIDQFYIWLSGKWQCFDSNGDDINIIT